MLIATCYFVTVSVREMSFEVSDSSLVDAGRLVPSVSEVHRSTLCIACFGLTACGKLQYYAK